MPMTTLLETTHHRLILLLSWLAFNIPMCVYFLYCWNGLHRNRISLGKYLKLKEKGGRIVTTNESHNNDVIWIFFFCCAVTLFVLGGKEISRWNRTVTTNPLWITAPSRESLIASITNWSSFIPLPSNFCERFPGSHANVVAFISDIDGHTNQRLDREPFNILPSSFRSVTFHQSGKRRSWVHTRNSYAVFCHFSDTVGSREKKRERLVV